MIQNSQTSFYKQVERIPIDELQKMGEFIAKSGMFGCQTIAQGAVIAQHCEHLGISWLQWQADFDMVSGKPRMKAEAMLRRLRDMGGKYKWLSASDDAEKAVIEITFNGETIQASFTIEQAEKAGLIKKDGAWHTQRPAMLRARASTIGTRMIAPEALGGFATVEEAEEIGEVASPPSAPALDDDIAPAKAKRGPGRPKKDEAVQSSNAPRQQETQQASETAAITPAATATTAAAPAYTVSETKPEPAAPADVPVADPRVPLIRQCGEYCKELGIDATKWAVILEKVNCPADESGKRTLTRADETVVRQVLAWLQKQAEKLKTASTNKSAEEWANAGMPTQQSQQQAAAV